jgi:hypothetical protein
MPVTMRRFGDLALAATLLLGLLGVGVAGTHLQRELAAAATALVPSRPPDLLGPITEAGRSGWQCVPEAQAAARSWRDAALPDPEH